MKKIIIALAALFTFTVNAQTVSFNPRTGDVEMDGFLKDIHEKAKNDINAFTNTVVQTFNTSAAVVQNLLNTLAPGDVYMSFQTADAIGKPVKEVADAFTKHRDKGWGEIAKELGIKPGSPEFHAMKKKMKGDKGHGNGNGGGNGHGNGHGKKKQ